MGDTDFSTTHNPDANAHEVDVPVKTGLRITVPTGMAPAPTSSTDPLPFYQWPRWLVKADRSSGQPLVRKLGSSASDFPTVEHLADYTPEADSGSTATAPRKFTSAEWDEILANRQDAATTCGGKLFISQGGWAYNGTTAQDAKLTPAQMKTGSKQTLEWAQSLVWEELHWEGGYASINAYDSAKLTWGQGWSMNGGSAGLPGLMSKVWTLDDCKPLREAFLKHGIAWDAGSASFRVANANGYMESGASALELLIGTRELLAIFIKLGESPTHRQALVNAEFELVRTTGVGKVPAAIYSKMEDRLLMLMAHVGHGWSGQLWKYPNANNIHDFLMAWGTSAWKTRGSGAKTIASGQILNNLQHWGRGIAWDDAISKVCPGAKSFTDKDIDDPVNKGLFEGLLAIWNPEQKGFHFYPSLPPLMVFDDDLYNWAMDVVGYNMTGLLDSAQGLGTKAKSYLGTYNQSQRTIGQVGYRPRVALDAVVIKKAGAALAERNRLYADPHFKVLPEDQANEIRKYLGDKPLAKSPWDFWDGGDPATFFAKTQGYGMDGLISTYGARGYATADQLRVKYEGLGKPWGWRPWIAIMTVLNRGGGSAAGWIVTHEGYKKLPRDQRRAIRKTLGLPYSEADLDAEHLDPGTTSP